MSGEQSALATEHPAGDYAIVEILGHQTLIGRVEDVERFGTSMLRIEPIFNGRLLEPIFQGGASIYRFSPCTVEQAFERAPTAPYHLPPSVRALLPPEALPAPSQPQFDIGEPREDFADDDFEREDDEVYF